MILPTYFDLTRFKWLLFGDLVLEGRGLLAGAGAVAILAGLLWGILPVDVSQGTYDGFLFPAVLYVGGCVVSSRVFKKVHLPGFGMDYLTVPASHFEKFVSRLLLSGVLYAFAAAAFCTIVSVVVVGLRAVFGHSVSPVYNPFTLATLDKVGSYLVVQAVFVCGSLYFRRTALVKTALVIGAFAFVIAVYSSLLGLAILHGADMGGWFALGERLRPELPVWADRFKILRLAVWYASAPLFWFVGYLRLGELEA